MELQCNWRNKTYCIRYLEWSYSGTGETKHIASGTQNGATVEMEKQNILHKVLRMELQWNWRNKTYCIRYSEWSYSATGGTKHIA